MNAAVTKSKASKNSKFADFLNNKFVPIAGKIGNQTHLASIRDGFALITPLIIAGAFAILINQVFFGTSKLSLAYWITTWAQSGLGYDAKGDIIFNTVGQEITKAFSQIGAFVWNGTYQILSLFIAFIMGFLIGRRRKALSPVSCGLIGLAVFFVGGGSDSSMFSTQGLFPAILISFLAVEFFIYLHRVKKLQIKLPPQVPPSVGKAFTQLIPAILIVLITATVSVVFFWIPSYFAVAHVDKYQPFINNWNKQLAASGQTPTNLPNPVKYGLYNAKPLTLVTFVYKFFTLPFLTLVGTKSGGIGLAILYVLGISLFWFFGLHGTNIMNGVFAPIWLQLMVQNTNNYISGGRAAVQNIFVTSFFDGFVFMGGWGAGLSLLIATFIFSRNKQSREVSKFSIAPGLFNINEPITFAYPLMLNVTLLIPAFISPVILTVITYLAIGPLAWVPKVVIYIPWVSPVGIGGLLATISWQGFVLALFNVLVGVMIYIPFILLANLQAKKQGLYVQGNLFSWIAKIKIPSKKQALVATPAGQVAPPKPQADQAVQSTAAKTKKQLKKEAKAKAAKKLKAKATQQKA